MEAELQNGPATYLAYEVNDADNQGAVGLINANQQAVVHHTQAGQKSCVAPQRTHQPQVSVTLNLACPNSVVRLQGCPRRGISQHHGILAACIFGRRGGMIQQPHTKHQS